MPDPNSRPGSPTDLRTRPVGAESPRGRPAEDQTIGDLANKTEAELLACPNFGQTSLNEIKTKLDELGLALRG